MERKVKGVKVILKAMGTSISLKTNILDIEFPSLNSLVVIVF